MMRLSLLLVFIAAALVLHAQGRLIVEGPENATFDKIKAYAMVQLAFAAYCDESQINDWSCTWCERNKGFRFMGALTDNSTDTYGFVGYVNDTVVVSFRGSQSLSNWITNLKFSKETPYPAVDGASVHTGFYQAYLSVQSQVRQRLTAAFSKCGKHCTQAVITGHSLGGALATLCALDQTLPLHVKLSAYTYGSPRVGNEEFAAFYTKRVPTWRLTHDHDIVPHLPPTLLNFHHVATEVWQHDNPEKGEPDIYTQCDGSGEDPKCSNSVYGTSIADHLSYMGLHETCSPNAAALGIVFDDWEMEERTA